MDSKIRYILEMEWNNNVFRFEETLGDYVEGLNRRYREVFGEDLDLVDADRLRSQLRRYSS